ncbi:MAG: hypothetical protein LAP21_09310 [Acidobacteriia bacterium]|nr:hypothetical protein [Terriglobia bacterium]
MINTRRSAFSRLLPTTLAISILIGVPAFCQVAKPGMEIGTVTLRLGMSCDSATLQLNKSGYKLLNASGFESNVPRLFVPGNTHCDKDTELVATREDTTDPVKVAVAMVTNDGRLFFHNGLLVRIQKPLNLMFVTDRDLAAALYASIREFEKEGTNKLCSMSTLEETHAEYPDIESKQITLLCSLGTRTYRAVHVRWTTSMHLKNQLSVFMFQELWEE